MSAFAINVLVLILGTALGLGLDRLLLAVTGKSKPNFSVEIGLGARNSLHQAQSVFLTAQTQNGQLQHPWQIRGHSIYLDELENSLRGAIASIKNEALTKSIELVIAQLRALSFANYRPPVRVLSLEDLNSAAEIKIREAVATNSQLQLRISSDGLKACQDAFLQLDALSKNL